MVAQVLTVVALLLVAVAIYGAATLPKVVVVSRSQLIRSSPDKMFRYINNTRAIQDWNPFVTGDPGVPRVMSRFVNLERIIGPYFDAGLPKLKELAEHGQV